MKIRSIVAAGVILTAGFAVMTAGPALARAKHKAPRGCVDRPQQFTFGGIFFNPAPRPNGCAPAVYNYGKYVGQDPDANIRSQLLRDPGTGYSPL